MSDEFGTLMLSITIRGEEIRLATVSRNPDTELYETFIGLRFGENQLGRHDSSQERSIRKAEEYLIARLRKLT